MQWTSARVAGLGALAAIVITTTMDASGMSTYSALPLAPLSGAFWLLTRYERSQMGWSLGNRRGYVLALAHALLVPLLIGAIAWLAGYADFRALDATHAQPARHALRNAVLASTAGIPVTLLTEELFFRGWLWAALGRTEPRPTRVLWTTSAIFAIWHVSAVVLPTGFNPPPGQVPVFLANALLLGVIWGLLRRLSNSIVVSSVAHSVWNAAVYTGFGFGAKAGALGIVNTIVFGPEVGVLGLAANALVAVLLWRGARRDMQTVSGSDQQVTIEPSPMFSLRP
jgi:membrane protease YdiL (CAAX protease family)